MNEEEYRRRLVAQTRKRAQQIADGSYVNEPWAPSKATQRMCVERGVAKMHSTAQSYTIEWEDNKGEIHETVIYARSASQAEKKAEEILGSRMDFAKIEHVELYP